MQWNGLPLVIFGTSGMSKEVKCIIDKINSKNFNNQYDFLGFVGERNEDINKSISGGVIITSDDNFGEFISKYSVIGVVIPIGFPNIKRKIYNKLKNYNNIVYPNIISPDANIMDLKSIELGIGNIIVSGVTITTDIKIGNFNLVNMNASIGHDVVIEDYCVINPQVAVSGNVHIKSSALLGAGSSIKQGVTIGENSIVGLGGFVVKDVRENDTVICSPAKSMK